MIRYGSDFIYLFLKNDLFKGRQMAEIPDGPLSIIFHCNRCILIKSFSDLIESLLIWYCALFLIAVTPERIFFKPPMWRNYI